MPTYPVRLSFLLVAVVGLVAEGHAAISTSENQQKQTAYEYTYSGKSVRYETQPMHYVDGKGNKITAAQAGAKVDFCVDIQGNNKPNRAEYQRTNLHFYYKCNNGNEEVIACVGTERTKNAKILVGETLKMNGFWHKCERMANGSIVYTQSNGCLYGGSEYPPNAEFMMGPIKMMCTEDGARIIGCVYESNGEKIILAPGETKEFKNAKYFCQTQQNTVASNAIQSIQQTPGNNFQPQAQGSQKQSMQQPQQFSGKTTCTKDGRSYSNGEQFKANHIRYHCQNGYLQITGCYNGLGEAMNIGQDIFGKSSMVYRCYKTSGQIVEYTEYSCGYHGGPSCSPNEQNPAHSSSQQATATQSGGQESQKPAENQRNQQQSQQQQEEAKNSEAAGTRNAEQQEQQQTSQQGTSKLETSFGQASANSAPENEQKSASEMQQEQEH